VRERKSNRLRNYDYSESGYYFITIRTNNREECFGRVEGDEMHLNEFGEIARNFWAGIMIHFKCVGIDEFSVMPNHVHGILIIEEVGNAYMRSLQDRTKMLLSKIIQQYKASVTRKINSLQHDFHFGWQKSFYDHIIRNEESLNNIRHYIRHNPLKWESDIENIDRSSSHKNCSDYYEEVIQGHWKIRKKQEVEPCD